MKLSPVFCPPLTLLALLSSSFHRGPAFHPECSRSGKAPSVWIVALLDIISSSVTSPFRLSPRFENFSASVLSSVGSPPFATDVSITFHDFAPTIELSKRLWVFSSTRYFVRRCFRCYWLTHEIREENAARIKIATSSMTIEILLKWLALVF